MSHIQLQAGCDHIILLGDLIMAEEENDFAVEAVDGRRRGLRDEGFPWIESWKAFDEMHLSRGFTGEGENEFPPERF